MKPHRFDAVSFISGCLLVAVGLVFLIPFDVSSLIDALVSAVSWAGPVIALAVGLALILSALRPDRDPTASDS